MPQGQLPSLPPPLPPSIPPQPTYTRKPIPSMNTFNGFTAGQSVLQQFRKEDDYKSGEKKDQGT